MKREDIEKAAKDYTIGKTHFRRNVLKEVDADDYVLRKDNCREDFMAGAEWRINSVWHSITVIPDCHCFIVFLPKKSTIGSKNPIMGILEENRTFISSRPGCILCRLDEMESWAYLDDLLP